MSVGGWTVTPDEPQAELEVSPGRAAIVVDVVVGPPATVVVVSHQAQTIEKFCNSAAVLRDGKLYQFETLEEAKQYYDYTA